MLREAELFAMAEQMLVEVLGRIGAEHRAIVLPPMYDLPGIDDEEPLSRVVEQYVLDDASLPEVLGDAPADEDARIALLHEVRGDNRQAAVKRVANAAIEAAGQVADGGAVVHSSYGDLPVRDYLLRVTVSRSLLAHYVAAYLGSTACPLPEELARPLWEMTEADADAWRRRGVFRDRLPVPDKASWRDTFLRTAGHEPHPLGH
jgi:hypothetical protein